MRKLKRTYESDYDSYFNGYTYDTVPKIPSIGGIPQYNPMIVEDRIELMEDVKNTLCDYWFSEDPRLEDEICRWTKDGSCLYVRNISWDLAHPDELSVSFGFSGYDKDNKHFDKLIEQRFIDIDFENFLGRDIEGNLVEFLNKKISYLLDAVFHGGLKNEDRHMIIRKRVNEYQKSIKNEYLLTDTADLLNSNIEIILDLAKGNLISTYYDGKGNYQDNILHLKRLLSMMAHPDRVRPGLFEYELEATGCKDVNELLDRLLNCILDYKESHIDVAIQTFKDIKRDLNTV